MEKRITAKFSLNPEDPVDAELIKRLNAVGARNKSSHLRLAACKHFGVLDHLAGVNNPYSKDTATDKQNPINDKDGHKDDPLDGSSVFASAFDNVNNQ
jgi:hypothetical protein